MQNVKKYIPHLLLTAYVIEFIILSFNPHDRAVWFTENMTVLPIAVTLFILYCFNIRFSNISYIMMSVLIYMHTYGGHYTFALAPFDWFNNLFNFERNMYDRVAHMTVGFYAYPMLEMINRYKIVNKKWFAYFSVFMIIPAVAAFYELFEWHYAISSDPTAGIAVLGSQGDIWDAQKDILMDTIGGLIGVIMYYIFSKSKSLLTSKE